MLGLAGLQSRRARDVFAAVRRLVAAALQILWTGQSLLAVFFFFVNTGKQEVFLSWPFPSIGNYQLLPRGGSTERAAGALSHEGLGVKGTGRPGWPTTSWRASLFFL